MTKTAVIDLGTNTFHLLIAESGTDHYRISFQDRILVKIGEDGISKGVITDSAIERAAAAMDKFVAIIGREQVQYVKVFATSAIRNAENSSELLSSLEERTGFKINVISGDQEAEYIYYGVKSGLEIGEDSALIMDIGGGSVEFIIGNQHEISWKRSFEIGAQRLVDMFHREDPIEPDNIDRLKEFFNENLDDLSQAVKEYNPRQLIGSSGTFDTLSEIHMLKEGIGNHFENSELPLTIDSVYSICKDLISKNREERMTIPGMIEMRVDMIVVATSLVRYILDTYQFRRIRVSTHSLKEGVLHLMSKD